MEPDNHWLDGVPFKISERYRPPPKVKIPPSVQAALENASFSMVDEQISDVLRRARMAVTQVEEFRVKRDAELRGRELRLEERRKQKEEENKAKDQRSRIKSEDRSVTVSQVELELEEEDDELKKLAEEFVPNTAVSLTTKTEVVADVKAEQVLPPQPVRKLTNFAEFENGTSPFEDLELKSLNDKAELASLLMPATHSYPVIGPGYNPYHRINNYSENSASVVNTHKPLVNKLSAPEDYSLLYSRTSCALDVGRTNFHSTFSVPSVTQGVDQWESTSRTPDQTASILQQETCQPSPSPPSTSEMNLPNPYFDLSLGKQYLVRQMVDMGFDQARSARAVKKFGDDSKKVLDHLLLVQSLEEAGHPGSRVEQALLRADQSEAENVKLLLELTNQFVNLGFSEEAVIDALVRSKNDRDAALDLLVA